MQEDGGSKRMSPVLEQHWEKMVLGVVVVLALVYLGTKFSAGSNPAVKGVDAAVLDVAKRKEGRNDKIEAPKTVPEPKLSTPPTANRPPEWTAFERTIFSFNVIRGPGPLPTKFRFPDVKLSAPEVGDDGKVRLSWSLSKIEPDPNQKPPIPVTPKPETYYYVIERREKGGEWKPIEPQLKSARESERYQDGDTKAKTEYEYKVSLGCNDTAYVAAAKKSLTEKSAGPVAATTPGIWFVTYSNIHTSSEDDPNPKPSQAYVTIRKYDKDYGLVEWRKIQHEGEELGVITENGVAVSKHKAVTKDGRSVVVDFKMGGKIKRVTTGKMVMYDYQECTRKLDKDQNWVCEGPKKVSASYKVNEVLFTDEDGKDQAFTTPDGPGPIGDKLCQDHGGAPPPKELTAEERRAQREEEATKLMDQADQLWASEKPEDQKKAQKMYERLLASFVDLESVKPRKSEITARIKKVIK